MFWLEGSLHISRCTYTTIFKWMDEGQGQYSCTPRFYFKAWSTLQLISTNTFINMGDMLSETKARGTLKAS